MTTRWRRVFFATLEKELISKKRFASRYEASQQKFAYIEGFYNTRRKHTALNNETALNNVSPRAYERRSREEVLVVEEAGIEKEENRVINVRGLFAEEEEKGMVPMLAE